MATKSQTTKSQTKLQQPIPFSELFTQVKKENNFVTPRQIEVIFNLEQPIVRRHLRTKFAEPFKHELGQKWEMGIDLDTTKEVMQYFYERFPIAVASK